MTNKEAHEEAAGITLEPLFFIFNKIDPDDEYIEINNFVPYGRKAK